MRGTVRTTAGHRVRGFVAIAALVTVLAMPAGGCKGGEPEPGAWYRLDTPAVTIAAGAAGDARIRFVPRDGYHWNPEFPARLKVSDAGSVIPDKTEFSLGAGDFQDDAGTGSLSIRVSARAAGATAMKGVADFSVCNAKECRIFKQIAVEVPIHVQ